MDKLTPKQYEDVKKKLSDREWRVTSGKLYYIKNKQGKTVPFIPNEAQQELLEEIKHHGRFIIPKARQKGFSTLIAVLGFDRAMFNKNYDSLIIAQEREAMTKLFKNKIQFLRNHLPERLKENYETKTDKANELSFSLDGKSRSSISVALSGRSGTYQFLHVSEFGKICAKYPAKAEEINSGAIEAVPLEGLIFIESTAEGDEGLFYDRTMGAEELQESGEQLSPMDYKLLFSPWYTQPEYRLNFEKTITKEYKKYFDTLETEYDIQLDDKQKRRYIAKDATLGDNMKREYPSVLKECFETSIEGSYYARYIVEARKQQRIQKVAHESELPVHVAFDLGGANKGGDLFSMWFFQIFGKEVRIINYREGNDSLKRIGAIHLPTYGYTYGKLVIPRDGFVVQASDGKARISILQEQGYNCIKIGQGTISGRIDTVKNTFSRYYFDGENCDQGIKRLRNYRKKRNSSLGRFMEEPNHDINSHGADAFGYLAQSLHQLELKPKTTQQRTVTSAITNKPINPADKYRNKFQRQRRSSYL